MDAPRFFETHISWVALLGDRAYKLMKPVDAGFLDHRARSAREAACHRELEHNRRFAPDVYLGVLDILEADGTPRDHLLEMRRLPADRRLSALLDATGADARVREVAEAAAGFHRAAPRSAAIDRCGEPAHLAWLWQEGWRQMREDGAGAVDPERLDAAERLAWRYLHGRRPLLEGRIADGWVRDGHGDLLADDVYCMDDGPRVLDCLAFDDRLRRGDVLSDIGFLAMDLESRGHGALAGALLEHWARALGEEHPPSLAHHHIAYRAHVRAKVAAIRAGQGDEEAGAHAAALHDLCLDHLRRGAVRLVLVGGPPGTGKSTLASALAEATGWSVISTDAHRDAVVGPPGAGGDAYGHGRYGDDARDRVYTRVRELAGRELSMGRSVILDASWGSESRRRAAREMADDVCADVVELRCAAPADVAEARIAARAGDHASEATAAIAERMRAAFDDWPAAVAVDTAASLEDSVAAAREAAGPV